VKQNFKGGRVTGKGIVKVNPKILKSSWNEEEKALNNKHGLTAAVLKAYTKHHAIILKPDCFWQAILTQFGFYVNAHAE